MGDIDRELSNLKLLMFDNIEVYHSHGCRREADVLGRVADDSYAFLGEFFEVCPEITVLVLDRDDWEKRAPGVPYGNPFVPNSTIHYGVEPPGSWIEALVKLAGNAPPSTREELATLSGSESNDVEDAIQSLFTLDFFSATVAHEMAHPFLGENLVLPQPIEHKHAYKLDAFWIGEFIPQYAMHSFLQSKNRPLCKKWLTLMRAAYEGGLDVIRHSGLREMGARYTELLRECVENIYWYQAKLFVMSDDIHQAHGEDFLKAVVEGLRLNEALLLREMGNLVDLDTWLKEWDQR